MKGLGAGVEQDMVMSIARISALPAIQLSYPLNITNHGTIIASVMDTCNCNYEQ